ncbi:14730_t:CDS:1, partial [Funneliformis caledonium]
FKAKRFASSQLHGNLNVPVTPVMLMGQLDNGLFIVHWLSNGNRKCVH